MKLCPACGAEVPSGDLECSYCGSNVVPVALSFEARQEIDHLIQTLNIGMVIEKKKVLRAADLLSTGLWLVGIFLAWILFALNDLLQSSWLGMFLFSGLALYLGRVYRRRRLVNGLIQFFRTEIDPEIIEITRRLNLPRWQFDQMCVCGLHQNDPLRKFMFFRSTLPKD